MTNEQDQPRGDLASSEETTEFAAVPEEPPPAEPAPPPPPPRRLTRSRRDSIIGGVAGGLAEYLDVDPTLVRIAIVVLAFLSAGTVVLVYIAAWIIIPEGPAPGAAPAALAERRRGSFAPLFWGVVLILLGVLLLLWRLDVSLPRWDAWLAGLLIAVGLLIMLKARGGLHGGLLAVALLLTIVLGVAAVFPSIDSGFGERTFSTTTVQDLDREYGHAFGRLRLDLRQAEFPAGVTELKTSIAFGDLVIQVPPDVGVRSSSTTLFGSTQLLGEREHSGFSTDAVHRSENYTGASSRLHIEITTLFGSTRVER